ncbi:NAD(+)/NADH kinase [Mucilaginibacter lappiensis]|uniref:Uncharacterized protein n=1 Tax=Mucilaginibacter lappiensis TaxID=354630 RepID=A0A1N6PU72_9SPHI|nr:hypothetical protein [Mucilaginibacter lappiensis]MBB6107459.1 hypothetical protein [Mucilaginibacter lappiensis]MBB6126223.1 hypothetical protein [Mucilaginibacter lappiensis]SIQ07894.1 hypothetical protein SAMN05421821_101619 [Mucilaginibacter lappiensis]
MLDYIDELNELKELFDDLGNYSKINAYMLQVLLERYDGVVEQLYCINDQVFRSSVATIIEAENELSVLMNDELPSVKKKLIFEINKFKLKIAVNSDLSRYGHYKMIQQINYN